MKAIEASPKSIDDLLQLHEFVIPEYQRPYSWGADEVAQLWDDLSEFLEHATAGGDGGKDRYFLGSIVVYPNPENDKVWDVIDGQQRLTTLLMLIKTLFDKASTYTILLQHLYKVDPKTGVADRNSPRLESRVLGDNDRESFIKVLAGDLPDEKKRKKNPFFANYTLLENLLAEWWENKDPDRRGKIITALRDKVVLLPIVCDSADDALTLFQIVNDRGKPLADSDIFKAKLYKAASEDERESFMTRWEAIDSHEDMFRIYMHILRANDGKGDTSKEKNLREYINSHLGKATPSSKWGCIMNALEGCYHVRNNSSSDNEWMQAEENIYWGILKTYPNVYWQYPLHVFLHKHMKREDDTFILPKEQHEEYAALLQDTARYFFVKAVVHNSVNVVKDVTFRVCADIAQGRDYAKQYRANADEKDMKVFEEKLKSSDLGRCRKGLVLLAASLNPAQSRADYGNFIQRVRVDIEHILPKKWNNYDKWDEESYGEHLNTLGNLMPLEKKQNIKASNEFFGHKQEEYGKSKVQDALDLAKKDPSVWYPEDVVKRHDESLNRLREFFRDLHR